MTMAEHHFDIDIAEKYGVNAAIILNNMYFWIKKNEANNVNFYDGCYWTYNSVKAFCDLFPYLSKSQITTALKKLESAGVIKTGNYNKSAYDRTTWYAFTEMGNELLGIADSKNKKSISDFNEMDFENIENGKSENSKPIPYENPNIKQLVEEVVLLYNSICVSFSKVQKISDRRVKAIKEILKQYNVDDIQKVFTNAENSDFLKGNNDRNWKADFDWLIDDEHFLRVLEDKYIDRNPKQQPQQSLDPKISYKGKKREDMTPEELEAAWNESWDDDV